MHIQHPRFSSVKAFASNPKDNSPVAESDRSSNTPSRKVSPTLIAILATVCPFLTTLAPDSPVRAANAQAAQVAAPDKVMSPAQTKAWIQGAIRDNWEFYKARHMETSDAGMRVIANNDAWKNATISEGQSYAMLSALLLDDQHTFEETWRWTKANLQQRPGDKLLGWKLEEGGKLDQDGASDADEDIAYALILAGEKWNRKDLLQDGLAMAKDVYKIYVKKIAGKPYLAAGTSEFFAQNGLTINPSYYAPYVYRKFAELDKENAKGWMDLSSESYKTLDAAARTTKMGLAPNWVHIKPDGTMTTTLLQGPGSDGFGYDSFRVNAYRLTWDNTPEARALLAKQPFLLDSFKQNGKLPNFFSIDGKAKGEGTGFLHITAFAQSHAINPLQDSQMVAKLVQPLYNETTGAFGPEYNDFLQSALRLGLFSTQLVPGSKLPIPQQITIPVESNPIIAQQTAWQTVFTTVTGVAPTTANTGLKLTSPMLEAAWQKLDAPIKAAEKKGNLDLAKGLRQQQDIIGTLNWANNEYKLGGYTAGNLQQFAVLSGGPKNPVIKKHVLSQAKSVVAGKLPTTSPTAPKAQVPPAKSSPVGSETKPAVTDAANLTNWDMVFSTISGTSIANIKPTDTVTEGQLSAAWQKVNAKLTALKAAKADPKVIQATEDQLELIGAVGYMSRKDGGNLGPIKAIHFQKMAELTQGKTIQRASVEVLKEIVKH